MRRQGRLEDVSTLPRDTLQRTWINRYRGCYGSYDHNGRYGYAATLSALREKTRELRVVCKGWGMKPTRTEFVLLGTFFRGRLIPLSAGELEGVEWCQ